MEFWLEDEEEEVTIAGYGGSDLCQVVGSVSLEHRREFRLKV